MLKNPTVAALLTIALSILGIAGDAMFGASRTWTLIENVFNFPITIARAFVGPGHGFAQLVFPMLFALLFYFAGFWALLVYFQRGANPKGN